MRLRNTITDVPGIEVGHAQDDMALTGCTVVLARQGAVAGVDVRGGAPGTRETDLLSPLNLVEKIHAVMLAGGSAYGLDAASGAMRYLEENRIGFETGAGIVPIVPAAIIFDLGVGRSDVRPNAEMGYRACVAASAEVVPEGNMGAGTGASIGRIAGSERAVKSGLGCASIQLTEELIVGALAVVNTLGDVIDPANGRLLAGVRSAESDSLKIGEPRYFGDSLEIMKSLLAPSSHGFSAPPSTLLGVVAMNAALTKAQATKVAQMAQDALARTIRPSHTMFDGDTVFALATGGSPVDVSTLGAFTAEALALAILRAVRMAAPAGGLPGLNTPDIA